NLGRGAAIDEPALAAALSENRIRGAALDVFQTEPLPPGHPFWTLDNVLLSPHSADHTRTWMDESMLQAVDFLTRRLNGEPLTNVVDKQAGY
ncbi:MAG: hypothetical protein MUC42_18170, partial [Bryobacter sp.]|nr:hypothetical protein [Bryobacter sp.]